MKMPKNKKEFIEKLKLAFTAGCDWGFGIEHIIDVAEQEKLGAMVYVGEITIDEANRRKEELINSGDKK